MSFSLVSGISSIANNKYISITNNILSHGVYSSFSNDMFFSNDLLSCCQSIGALLRASLHLVCNGRVSFLLLAVLVEKDDDEDHHSHPDQHAHDYEA